MRPRLPTTSTVFVVACTAVVVVALASLAITDSSEPPAPRAAAPAACRYRAGGELPDRRCTPGAINHAVTQRTIRKTICKVGWTATVRPPISYTAPLKRVMLAAYGQPQQPQRYELDHLIPLELGGATADPRNLWPEPDASPNPKDAAENRLRRAVCAGRMTLAAARRAIRTDWRRTP